MEFFDTHCHIHFPDYKLNAEDVLARARQTHVANLLCVGCSLEDSQLGIEFASDHENVWASIGLHPHEAQRYVGDEKALKAFTALASSQKVVAVGECGLDYYYNHSPKKTQATLLRFQIELALKHDLPLVFHVRDAFDDFWKIFDEYKDGGGQKIRGVIHSFSAGITEIEQILARDLYIGLNGIMTFTKDQNQLEAAKLTPLDKLLLETDAPYLTPAPYRGTICEPKHVSVTAQFLSRLRGETLEGLSAVTTQNAKLLFGV